MKLVNLSMEELYAVLRTKSVLILLKFGDSGDVFDAINDPDIYNEFVHSINYLLEVEPLFFLLDDSFIDNTFKLFDTHRFDKEFTSDSDILEKENYLIRELNSLKYLPDEKKREYLVKYIGDQFLSRRYKFDSIDGLLLSQACDYFVINRLIDGKSNLPDYDFVLMSLNYYLEKYSSIFYKENILDNTKELLSEIHFDINFKNIMNNIKLRKIKKIINNFGE